MTAKQLSIFMENRSGTLINVLEVLKKAQIQILASTIADTAEYGIYRIICDQPKEAFAELRTAEAVYIPASVSAIAADAFDHTGVIIAAPAGSYALEWAEANGFDRISVKNSGR